MECHAHVDADFDLAPKNKFEAECCETRLSDASKTSIPLTCSWILSLFIDDAIFESATSVWQHWLSEFDLSIKWHHREPIPLKFKYGFWPNGNDPIPLFRPRRCETSGTVVSICPLFVVWSQPSNAGISEPDKLESDKGVRMHTGTIYSIQTHKWHSHKGKKTSMYRSHMVFGEPHSFAPHPSNFVQRY